MTATNNSMWNLYISCFKKYFDFKGRATRKEFGAWLLFTYGIAFSLTIVGALLFEGSENLGLLLISAAGVYMLACFIPGLAVGARRFHDLGKSGWIYASIIIGVTILSSIPSELTQSLSGIISIVCLLYMLFSDSVDSNEYGPKA